MLVLTRKLQEQICVGNDITITILRIKGNSVRIGIEAPRGVRVIRGELPTFDSEGDFDGEPAETESAMADPAQEPAAEEVEEAPLAAVLRRTSRNRCRAQSAGLVYARA
jgi:carbon storage regulator CsrA